MFLTHSDEALEIEKFKRSRENKIKFAYDYGNLNASYVNEKINLEDDYFQEIIDPDFDKIDSLFQQTSSFKPYVSNVILEKIIIDMKDEVVNLLEKEKENLETIEMNDLLDDNNFFIFDDVNVRISPVSKMPFSKKPCDSMHIVQICLWIIDSGCSKHMTGNRALLANFVEKFLGTVRFGNNNFALIAGYGDVVIGSMTIKKVYYVDGLGHNLFSVRQFCDKGLEASSSQSWLWHQCLSHLNFATINNLVKNNLVQGLPKMKFEKDHLCSACEQGKIHRKHHKSKTAFALNKHLYLLHMDLCGPMHVQSINGKRYVLVVVDDSSRYTWVFFLYSKDEASENTTTNGVVERRNRTLVEAARTMLTFANLPSFLWTEAIATACFTQNHVIFSMTMRILKRSRLNEILECLLDIQKKMASKQFSLEPGLSNLNETGKSSNQSVSQVDEASKKDLEDLLPDFYDEYFDSSKIMKSLTTNVETPIIEEDDVQQSPEEVILPQKNTQSIPINMVPNGDEASTSHNVFNERLEDAYFDAKLEGCISNKDVEIEKGLERLNECENKLHKIGQTNQTIHMIMTSKNTLYNGRKGIGFENPSYVEKVKDLRPSLYDETVICLGYIMMFLIHSNEALEIKKFKRARENKIEFAYDYGNLNASYVNEKIQFSDDYFQEIINPDFEKIDSLFQQTSSLKSYVLNVILEKIIIDLEDEVVSLLEKEKANLETIESLKSKGFESSENAISKTENQSENDFQVVEKECDNVENPKVIAPEMFKSSVSQSVSPISMPKTSCDSKNVKNKTKRKRHLDTFSSVRRPKQSSVIWKKKGSSNNSNVDLSSVSYS
uniref:Uncharacterized protein n=1 Tax=Tanacetum cinerariifolium TaxID=118510 RepID=A0A6L2JC07_TANCI|nr:hypothetical protein [Tanacetum cinerariifolium]